MDVASDRGQNFYKEWAQKFTLHNSKNLSWYDDAKCFIKFPYGTYAVLNLQIPILPVIIFSTFFLKTKMNLEELLYKVTQKNYSQKFEI